MATTGHTVKAFDEELDQLRATICEMGGLAEERVRHAVQQGAAAVHRNGRFIALQMEGRRIIGQRRNLQTFDHRFKRL